MNWTLSIRRYCKCLGQICQADVPRVVFVGAHRGSRLRVVASHVSPKWDEFSLVIENGRQKPILYRVGSFLWMLRNGLVRLRFLRARK